jgi:hypothetical protein
MYNIHSHYEHIFSFLKTKMPFPVLLHFYPFGSIDYDNIEYMHANGPGEIDLPVFLCYDQEPLSDNVGVVIQKIRNSWGPGRQVIILLNTETNSEIKNQLLEDYQIIDCSYFFHIFAAADWYRGYQYCIDLIDPGKRKIKKKYISFNRITGNSRVYRSFFVSELSKHQLLDHGYVSYSDVCPVHGHYEEHVLASATLHGVPHSYVIEAKNHLDSINFPLRIDFKTDHLIPNGSQTLNAIPEMMESFLHVVTETCFWETKDHLTEKIFKPIVARQPFVLLGCANNLAYLKSYGFKTFDSWWDEGYDKITDPIERIQEVVKIIKYICSMPDEELEGMLHGMQYILDHNYNLFYSKDFINDAWAELTANLEEAYTQSQPLMIPRN